MVFQQDRIFHRCTVRSQDHLMGVLRRTEDNPGSHGHSRSWGLPRLPRNGVSFSLSYWGPVPTLVNIANVM